MKMPGNMLSFEFLVSSSFNDNNYQELGSNFTTEERIVLGLLIFLVFLFGLIGNLFIIVTSYRLLVRKDSVPNYLILYLGVVDLCGVLLIYKPLLLNYVFGRYIGGVFMCNLNGSGIIFFVSFSIVIMLSIILDRYLAVSTPYFYQDKVIFSKTKAIVFIFICTLISVSICLPPLVGLGSNTLYHPGSFCMFTTKCQSNLEKGALIFYKIVLDLFILLALIGSIAACVSVHKMMKYRAQFSARSSGNTNEEKIFIRLSLVTMLVFIITWSPLSVHLGLQLFHITSPGWYTTTAFSVAAFHPVVNPWLYPLLRNKFRKAFKFYLHSIGSCFCCCCIVQPDVTLDNILHEDTTYTERQQKTSTKEMRRLQSQEANQTTNIRDYVDNAPKGNPKGSSSESDRRLLFKERQDHDIEMDSLDEDINDEEERKYSKRRKHRKPSEQ